MAEVEATLHALLTADPGVSALVDARVYPLELPQNPTLPAIRYQTISRPPEYTQSGPAGLAHPRIQFDAYAYTYAAAKELATAIRAAIDGGVGGDLQALFVDDERDLFEDDVSDAAGRVYRVSMDIRAWAAVA